MIGLATSIGRGLRLKLGDWGWSARFDLDAMTDDLVPRVRALLEHDPAHLGPTHA